MKEHLGFLKASSIAIKIAAGFFLFFGAAGSIFIFLGRIPGRSNVEGVVNLAGAIFFFFFLYIIAKIADLLVKIIHEIQEIKKA